jgi:DNA-binding transcriptional ArsR family regulator
MNGGALEASQALQRSTVHGFAASLDPIRARLLAELSEPLAELSEPLAELSEPHSATMQAGTVGQPRQKINYHLRELELHGLVELVEERRKGNVTERVMRTTAFAAQVRSDVPGRSAFTSSISAAASQRLSAPGGTKASKSCLYAPAKPQHRRRCGLGIRDFARPRGHSARIVRPGAPQQDTEAAIWQGWKRGLGLSGEPRAGEAARVHP